MRRCFGPIVLLLVGCPGPLRSVEAFAVKVAVSCDGGCPDDVQGLYAGHCGDSISRPDQAGVRTAIGAGEAIVVIDTSLEDGGVVRQRTQWSDLEPVRGWFAPSPRLYALHADGGFVFADAGAGPSFSYLASRPDGGLVEVTEFHVVTRAEPARVQSYDPNDIAAGCCAAVGPGTPVALAALLLLHRARRR